MGAKKKGMTLGSAAAWLLGIACALVLGAVFYGAMVYQLTGTQSSPASPAQESPAPLAPGSSADTLYPGALLALPGGTLAAEKAEDVTAGGQTCRVITRTYTFPSGVQAKAVSAYPAAYLEKMTQEKAVPQLVTGFSLAGLDALYALRGSDALLCARDGDYIYMIEAQTDEQTLYMLGAGAQLE